MSHGSEFNVWSINMSRVDESEPQLSARLPKARKQRNIAAALKIIVMKACLLDTNGPIILCIQTEQANS